MGIAKQRRLKGEMPYQNENHENVLSELTSAVETVVADVRKMAVTFVEDSRNCLYEATLLSNALNQHFNGKYSIRPAAGYAMWRVNKTHPAGTIGNHPDANGVKEFIPNDHGMVGHAWVIVNNKWIIDTTTISWPKKLNRLTQLDGHSFPQEWIIDFLILPMRNVKTFRHVQMSYECCAHYEEHPSQLYFLQHAMQSIQSRTNKSNLA